VIANVRDRKLRVIYLIASGIAGALVGIASGIATFFIVFYSPVPFFGMGSMVGFGWLTTIPAIVLGFVVMQRVSNKVTSRIRAKQNVDPAQADVNP
jgi:hypothetical protein